ncbi:hypothetical protein T261_4969 [Streptomyces lydicus]|nr:hypothetical protein T261_4969 [Streptomyces lydicus]
MHDLPGIGRIRWRGMLLPEPTCRHRGCPLAGSGFGAQPMPCRNTLPPPPAPPTSARRHATHTRRPPSPDRRKPPRPPALFPLSRRTVTYQ